MKRGYKWAALALAIALGFAFGIKSIPLERRGIIVGLGIDYTPETEKYTLSAQILMHIGSDNVRTPGAKTIVVEGPSISESLWMISETEGRVVLLSHCDVILLGKEILKGRIFETLDYMVRNETLSRNVQIVGTEEKAEDIMTAKTAYGEPSSFYISDMLENFVDQNNSLPTSLQNLTRRFYTEGKGNWIPLLEKKECTPPENPESSGDTSKETYYSFDLTQSAIIKGGEYVFKADSDMTQGISYFTTNIRRGPLHVKNDAGKTLSVLIVHNSYSFKKDIDANKLTAKIKVKVMIREMIGGSDNFDSIYKHQLTPSEDERLKAVITEQAMSFYEEGKKNGIDVLDIHGRMRGKGGKKWDDTDYLERTTVETKVEITYT